MSEGSSRRDVLRLFATAPLALLAKRGSAAEETISAERFLNTADRLEGEVADRLGAIARVRPAARAFVASVGADRARHRALRAELRTRLGLPKAPPGPSPSPDDLESLSGLRAVQKDLVYAHVEGLPSFFSDPNTVDRLGKNMVDLARQLVVIDLWIEGRRA